MKRVDRFGLCRQSLHLEPRVQLETRKLARLDRGLCDGEWRRLFPSTMIFHLAHAHPNHCPHLLKMNGTKMK